MVVLRTCQRAEKLSPKLSLLEDTVDDATCRFLRFLAPGEHALPGVTSVQTCPAGGLLLEGKESFWLPRLPVARRLDQNGHILEEQLAPISEFHLDEQGLTVSFRPLSGWVVDTVFWHVSPRLKDELTHFYPLETQTYFLWGSHTQYQQPADFYLHLIHGWLYENRSCWPKYWKICSENDAHALYVLFSGLERATGKKIYRLFKQQLILSVLHRQAEDGGFYHGEWTDAMESHFRLVASAAHLLMDALKEYQDPAIEQALVKVTDFLSQQHDWLDCGIWFLHDSLEKSEEAMRTSPFSWLPSRAFGKSVSNMLVLNTHWDISLALARAAELLHRPQLQLVEQANQATLAVLAARPGELWYRLAFALIALSFLPTARAASLPLWRRALKRLGWKYLIPNFHRLKQRIPRLVMPGGYLDRALSLKGISTAYQAINVMDLARLQARFPTLELSPYLHAAIEFTYASGLWQRWLEEEKSRYALGFWAEALRWVCASQGEKSFAPTLCSQRIAETMVWLDRLALGQPPSLLGGNGESSILPLSWRAESIPENLRVADLGGKLLLVNTGEMPVSFDPAAIASLDWGTKGACTLIPGAWMVGR